MREFDFSEIDRATGGFAAERIIGKGSHGRVYAGVLAGGRHVAVKSPAHGDEIELLTALRSRNIVSSLGFARRRDGEKLLIMDFMPNGSLHHLLHVAEPPPPWARRADVALHIGRALRDLHAAAPPVVHRDVKPENVLFDVDRKARLADFGLAVRASAAARLPPAGTIGYLDPGYNGPNGLGPENDVFSFGVLLLELVSGRPAMGCGGEVTSVVTWATPLIAAGRWTEIYDRRLQPPRRGETAAVGCLISIADRCVRSERSRRPSMEEIVGEIKRVVVREFSFCCSVPIWRRTKKVVCRDDEEIDDEGDVDR